MLLVSSALINRIYSYTNQPTSSSEFSLRRPKPIRSATPPHHRSPRQLPQDPILYTPTSLSITHGHGPPTKRRRAKRTEEERIAYLKSDPYVAQFEAYRVLCASCDKWIRLRPNSTYCSIPWDAHRKSCLAKKISSKNTYALEERNSLFSKDPDVRKFDAERVLCAECDQWVAINPEDHLQAVQRWLAHKSSCQKIARVGRGPGMPYVMHSPEFPPPHGQRSPALPSSSRPQASPSLTRPTIATTAAARQHDDESPPPRSRRASISVSAPTLAAAAAAAAVQRNDHRDEKPPRRPSSESPIPASTSRSPLVSPTSSEAVALDVAGSPPQSTSRESPRVHSSPTNVNTIQSLSIQDSRRRNAEQRAATLRADPLISKVEANRVFCSLCQKWVQLRQDSSFCAYPWVQHRGKCVGRYQRRAQKAAEIAEIKARKASAASASASASPAFHHREREYYVQQPYSPSHAYPSHPHPHAHASSSSRYPPSHAYHPGPPPPPPPPPPSSSSSAAAAHHRYSRYDDRSDVIDSDEEEEMHMRRLLNEKRYSAPPPRYPSYSRRPAPYPPPPHPHSRAAAAYAQPPPPLPSRNGSYRSQRRALAVPPLQQQQQPPLLPPPPPPPPLPHPSRPPLPEADEEDDEEEEDQLLHSDPDESDVDGSPDSDPDTRNPYHARDRDRDRDRDGDIRMVPISRRTATTTTTATRFDLSNPTIRNRFIHHSIHHLFSTTFSLSEDELSVSTLLAYLNAAMPEGKWEDFDTAEVVRTVVGFSREKVELEGDLIRVKV
ncbi:hypothetical protein Moror_8684 [Moniliophthora roreri MCA 2997]|uniref:Uncharacterized protein n=1 Tax=Moniliophthora roreri (strain MCA 2997) TaxID=1381753 RepID=V2YD12_MONRO|nr:hypothetical protein Moror_8684 [Moniliophthora roreri MCA 2997]